VVLAHGDPRLVIDRCGRQNGQAGAGPGHPAMAVERTHAWGNQFKKLVWNTERGSRSLTRPIALAHTIITLRRLIRCAWTLYRWERRSQRRP
jgi:hypothetical protein